MKKSVIRLSTDHQKEHAGSLIVRGHASPEFRTIDGMDKQEGEATVECRTSRRSNNSHAYKNADLIPVYRAKTGGDAHLRQKIKQHFDVLGLKKVERIKFEKLLTLTSKKR